MYFHRHRACRSRARRRTRRPRARRLAVSARAAACPLFHRPPRTAQLVSCRGRHRVASVRKTRTCSAASAPSVHRLRHRCRRTHVGGKCGPYATRPPASSFEWTFLNRRRRFHRQETVRPYADRSQVDRQRFGAVTCGRCGTSVEHRQRTAAGVEQPFRFAHRRRAAPWIRGGDSQSTNVASCYRRPPAHQQSSGNLSSSPQTSLRNVTLTNVV